jgi:uncharacterized protein YbjT (DUF2867 family)
MLLLMRHNVSETTVAVLGATGATGRHVVAHTIRAGHRVVPVVRRPGAFSTDGSALPEFVWADVDDQDTLTTGLSGVDVVISTLGGAETGPTTVCTDAMRSTIAAMTSAGVPRLVTVSAHGVLESHDRSLYARAVWSAVPDRMKDKETMEHLIVDSAVDWTIVRPPTLTHARATGGYRVGAGLPIRLWHTIGREDLAGFLLREALDPEFVRGYPRIHR